MAMQTSDWIWLDGQIVPWDQATLHVGDHVVHYGSSVFEGIRAYELFDGPAVFCLDAHLDRLWNSCRIYRLEVPYSREALRQAILDTIRANGLGSCYIRPVVYRGGFTFHVDGRSCATHAAIILSLIHI